MSCEHATGATLLWLYGEGPEEHLHHVAGCAACAEVVAAHEEVLAGVAPVLPALAEVAQDVEVAAFVEEGGPEAEGAGGAATPALRVVEGRSRRWAPALVGVLALAAAVLLLVRFVGGPSEAGQAGGSAPQVAATPELAGVAVADTDGARAPADEVYVRSPFDGELDADLDDLELALDSLAHDLSTL